MRNDRVYSVSFSGCSHCFARSGPFLVERHEEVEKHRGPCSYSDLVTRLYVLTVFFFWRDGAHVIFAFLFLRLVRTHTHKKKKKGKEKKDIVGFSVSGTEHHYSWRVA